LLLLLTHFGCKSSDQPYSKITFTTTISDFIITVDAEGILEAKKNRAIVAPPSLSYSDITYLIPEGSEIKKGDVLVIFHDDQLEKEYKNAQNDLEIAEAQAKQKETQLKVERSLLESQLRIYEASAATAMLQLPKLEFIAPTKKEIKRLEIQKFEMQAEKIRQKLAALENIQNEEREFMEIKVKQAESKLKRYQFLMDQLVLKSPIDGIVIYAMNRLTGEKVQVGDVLYRGFEVMKIPDLSVMQVNMQIIETEAQKLKQGQRAVVTVSSAGDFRLPGKVSLVDKVAKPIKRGSKVKKVNIIVEIDSTYIELMPGLTAECSFIVEEFRDALVIPKECIFENDSIKIVYVYKNGLFIPRPVEFSHQSTDFVAIQNGVTDGEKLALRKPSSSFIKWPDRLNAP